MGDLHVDSAHFLGLSIALWLYGVYTVIFGATLMMMKKRNYMNKIIWGALISLYTLCTGNVVLSIIRVYQSFITYRDEPGTLVQLDDITNPIPPARDVFYAFSILVSDGLLLWRLRSLWARNNWVFGLALALVTVSYVTGITSAAYEIALAVTADKPKYKSKMEALSGATFGLILLSNLTINGLMAFRLWWFHNKMAPALHDRSKQLYRRVIIAIIESGAMYSAFMLIAVILYAAGATNAVFIPIYSLPAVVGLVPTLMILRLNWKPAMEGPNSTTAGETSPSVRWAAPTGSGLSSNNGLQSRFRAPNFAQTNDLSYDRATAIEGSSEKEPSSSLDGKSSGPESDTDLERLEKREEKSAA